VRGDRKFLENSNGYSADQHACKEQSDQDTNLDMKFSIGEETLVFAMQVQHLQQVPGDMRGVKFLWRPGVNLVNQLVVSQSQKRAESEHSSHVKNLDKDANGHCLKFYLLLILSPSIGAIPSDRK
jgi:hypothetical protein